MGKQRSTMNKKRKSSQFGSTVFIRPKHDPAVERMRIAREIRRSKKKLKLALCLEGLHPPCDEDGLLIHALTPPALRKLGVVVLPYVSGVAA